MKIVQTTFGTGGQPWQTRWHAGGQLWRSSTAGARLPRWLLQAGSVSPWLAIFERLRRASAAAGIPSNASLSRSFHFLTAVFHAASPGFLKRKDLKACGLPLPEYGLGEFWGPKSFRLLSMRNTAPAQGIALCTPHELPNSRGWGGGGKLSNEALFAGRSFPTLPSGCWQSPHHHHPRVPGGSLFWDEA